MVNIGSIPCFVVSELARLGQAGSTMGRCMESSGGDGPVAGFAGWYVEMEVS